jgi:Polyprenyl synthetase
MQSLIFDFAQLLLHCSDLYVSHVIVLAFALILSRFSVLVGARQRSKKELDSCARDGEGTPNTKYRAIQCPYEYILAIYGRWHFGKLVHALDPALETRDPALFGLILEIMDAVHFGAILVDDVADNSVLRKGELAAHHIYGASETINRAYLRLLEVTVKCTRLRPALTPFLLECLTQIHKGMCSIVR